MSELLALAWPLILSNSFWTIQFFLDAIFLTWYDTNAAGAVMMAGILFWTFFILLQTTTQFSTTFVAQYVGAGRSERVGPIIWQALYFAIGTGLAFLVFYPLAPWIMSQIGHDANIQGMEVTYFQCMSFCALPMLIVAACNSFFAGRGLSRIVLLVDASGTVVNVVLGYALIFGAFGLPRWGVAGAGWALVMGASVAACLSFLLMTRRQDRLIFATLSGWRFDRALFKRLMRFGVPSGLQWALDMVAFTLFVTIIGWFGATELTSSSIAHRINMLAFLPMLGIGQAVGILVGQRLGQNRPDLAELSAKSGLRIAASYMSLIALMYIVLPSLFIHPFRNDANLENWLNVSHMVKILLWFIAIYSLFNSFEVIFTFALRGAGDTLFVTWVSLSLAWPMMVVPTWLAWKNGWNFYFTWGFASIYIIVMAFVFRIRFHGGKWKKMRVIENLDARVT